MTTQTTSAAGEGTLRPLVGLCVAQAHSDNALNSLRLMLAALSDARDARLYRSVRAIKNRLHDVCPKIEAEIEKANVKHEAEAERR